MARAPESRSAIRVPATCTAACREYLISLFKINGFLNFVLAMVTGIDSNAETAHDALVKTAPSEEEREKLIQQWEDRVPMTDQLRRHRQFFLEIVLVRHIENYLGYLSALLFEIFTQRPETLRSSEKVDVEHVLSHQSIDSLVRSIAERKVEELSYKSFGDLRAYFEDRFGLELCTEDAAPVIVEAMEIRNISVHNRCIVNSRYIKRTSCDPALLGTTKHLYIDYLDTLVPLLSRLVISLDTAARKRLKLKGKRFTQPH